MEIEKYWSAIAAQDAKAIKDFFWPYARIRWHNTNEDFSVKDFIRANCEYPDRWEGILERTDRLNNLIICVVKITNKTKTLSFHVVSYITINSCDLIVSIDEYWGDDGDAPEWRQKLGIGRKINS